jgi:hypothetical protein
MKRSSVTRTVSNSIVLVLICLTSFVNGEVKVKPMKKGHVRIPAPPNADVTGTVTIDAEAEQMIYLVDMDSGLRAHWRGKGHPGPSQPRKTIRSATGELELRISNDDGNRSAMSAVRFRSRVESDEPTPAVQEPTWTAETTALIKAVVESEDSGDSSWDDSVVYLEWPGRVIGVEAWTADPTRPSMTFWPEVAVKKNAIISCDAATDMAQIQLLQPAPAPPVLHDLRPGDPPIIVPSAGIVRIATKDIGARRIAKVRILDGR